ncbi:MAG TPA: hypothetical protein VK718_09355 [Ferruginibacter sp.]|nr:hypothetical protein [Ferruginibacter sp.]
MSRIRTLLILITGVVCLTGCEKSTNKFVPDAGQLTGPDNAWYNVISSSLPVTGLKNALAIIPVSDSFTVSNTTTNITTPSGLAFTFAPNTFVNSADQYVTGTIQQQTLVIKTKGDLIRAGLSTVADNQLLISEGSLFLAFSQNGSDVQLANGAKYTVSYTTDSSIASTETFTANQAGVDYFNWTANTDVTNDSISETNDTTYAIISNNLKWMSFENLYDTNAIKTTVAIDMPSNFTNATSVAYLVFNNIGSVVSLYGDATSHIFSTTQIIPVGQQATMIVISKQGNDYYLGYQNFVTATPSGTASAQIVSMLPVISSIGNIDAYLNSL